MFVSLKTRVAIMDARVIFEPQHDKKKNNNKMTCAPIEDSDQFGHPPSLIRVFAVRGRNLDSLITH